jgi:DNA-binding IclR family transcriptional regulator
MAGNSADSGRSVTSKVIGILLTFANGRDHSLTEIGQLTGLPISTAHRLASELTAWGLLERSNDGHYRVGEQLRMIGSRPAPMPADLGRLTRRVMDDVAAAAPGTNVRLGVLNDAAVAYVERPARGQPPTMPTETAKAPVHATAMGKALLAFSPPYAIDMVIQRGLRSYTPFTLTDPDRLRHALGVIRLTGVAVCRREHSLDRYALAVPIFGAGGGVLASLELEVRDPRALYRLQPPLTVAARSLSRKLATSGLDRGVFRGSAPPEQARIRPSAS